MYSNLSECALYTVCCADISDDHCSTPQYRQLGAAVDSCETELTYSLVTYGHYCDADDADNNSLSSKENEDDCSIIASISELNLCETSDGKTGDRGNTRTEQFSYLLYGQQQSNNCCMHSPVHQSNWLNYSNYDVFDCSLDSEQNDLLTYPFAFTYKSNQFVDSLSPVLFKDI